MFEGRSITVIGASGSDSSPSVGAEARRGERRLLLISYHFPPSREVGARRWQQLSKFASEWNWTVDVVTLDPANIAAPDWAALEELPAGVRAYSVAARTLPLDRPEQHVPGPRSLTPRLPEHLASPLWFQVARRRERRVVQSAALIVTNTEPSRLAMQAAYPAARGRIIAILNGYDDEAIPRSQHGPCFVIAYAGSIYLDRDPRPLLRAAARVIRGCGLAPDQLRLEFMGEDATYGGTTLEQLADKEGIKGFIHVHGARPRAEAMQF